MATPEISIVDPDNGPDTDYTSLSAWQGGEQGDLTDVRDEIAVAKCRCTGGTADSTGFTIDGWETSETQYIKIWTDTAESYRHDGTWQTGNKYRHVGSSENEVVNILENFVQLIGLQIDTGSDFYNINYSGTGGLYLLNNILINSSDSSVFVSNSNTASYSYIVNNIVYDATGIGLYIRGAAAAGRVICYNNTIFDCGTGIRSRDSYNIAKNNLVIGCTDCYLETTAFEVADYNAFDEGTDPGTNGIDLSSSADADIFESPAASPPDLHLVSGSDAIGIGIDLSSGDSYYNFSDDIDGDTRSAWDGGADEFDAGGPAGFTLPFIYYYNQPRI